MRGDWCKGKAAGAEDPSSCGDARTVLWPPRTAAAVEWSQSLEDKLCVQRAELENCPKPEGCK